MTNKKERMRSRERRFVNWREKLITQALLENNRIYCNTPLRWLEYYRTSYGCANGHVHRTFSGHPNVTKTIYGNVRCPECDRVVRVIPPHIKKTVQLKTELALPITRKDLSKPSTLGFIVACVVITAALTFLFKQMLP